MSGVIIRAAERYLDRISPRIAAHADLGSALVDFVEYTVEAARREESRRRPEEAVAAPLAATEPGERRALGWIVAAFLLGVLIGVAVLFGYAWMRVPAG